MLPAVTCPKAEFGIRMGAMGVRAKLLCALAAFGMTLPGLPAQDRPRPFGPQPVIAAKPAGALEDDAVAPSLNDDDRLSLVAAALDTRVRRSSDADCSHLVHGIYQQAGFPYPYAPSSDLYTGVDSFERVKQPKTGDLVVWRGHVGIVIKPSQHVFFSLMTSGPGIDDYEARYWKSRGHPRFYHYVKSQDCSSCGRNAHRLLKINR